MSDVLIEDIFDVREIDPDGKKFDLVSRLFCESESFKMNLILDVNIQLYPIEVDSKFRLVICATLREDGLLDESDILLPARSKADQFEYVMHGKIYRIEAANQNNDNKIRRISVYVSYGGLLMKLTGEANHLQSFKLDSNVYLLMKKLAF
ncbi:hypothetical protein GJ496_004002 [Pomphorhynchus laevis]|nr:hypothetical protein GJ496_004002 [Pomphorhynchus laevis]